MTAEEGTRTVAMIADQRTGISAARAMAIEMVIARNSRARGLVDHNKTGALNKTVDHSNNKDKDLLKKIVDRVKDLVDHNKTGKIEAHNRTADHNNRGLEDRNKTAGHSNKDLVDQDHRRDQIPIKTILHRRHRQRKDKP